MRTHVGPLLLGLAVLALPRPLQSEPRPEPPPAAPEVVTIDAGDRTLHGVLYRPVGPGPFPAVLYNHGSAPGMLNQQAFEVLGPVFASRGWVFFAPYRRGQGLSAQAGRYIGDDIADARRRGLWQGCAVVVPLLALVWFGVLRRQRRATRLAAVVALTLCGGFATHVWAQRAGAATMVRLLYTEQFVDQRVAFDWLWRQPFAQAGRIATAGNSFGGIMAVLAAERADYCAAVDAAGGAESWAAAPGLRRLMDGAVRRARVPILFIQAENDYDVSPSYALSGAMREAGKTAAVKIYPRFGQSRAEGHSFAWRGSALWADDVFRFLSEHCGG